MKLAAIDFGTNSLRLLIADVSDKGTQPFFIPNVNLANVTQLGNCVHSNKLINEESVNKCASFLKDYLSIIQENNVQHTFALATNVFRDSINAIEIKEHFEQILGFNIEIISGEREARLMFKGISVNKNFDEDKKYICIDIGGGSTEILLSQGTNILNFFSLPLGCLRTKNEFLINEPPTDKEISNMNNHINKLLTIVSSSQEQLDCVFAFGGTVTTLAKILSGKGIIDVMETENCVLYKEKIQDFININTKLTDSEIGTKYRIFIDRQRESVLRSGILILYRIMDYFSVPTLKVTNQSILYGILYEKFKELSNS